MSTKDGAICLAALGPDLAINFRMTFGFVYPGGSDPCTQTGRQELWRASRTPDGPATLHLFVDENHLWARAFGVGKEWMLKAAPRVASLLDRPEDFRPACAKLRRLKGRTFGLRLAQTPTVLDALLPTILGQRVKVYEARRSWSRIVRDLGEPAPGPVQLWLPPDPKRLVRAPSWWFAQHGVEQKRSKTMVEVCRHAARLDAASPDELPRLFRLIKGLGPWTLGNVQLRAFGDPDALIVGDYNLPHMVTHFFTGAARGDDEQMLDLLAPYAGQRGRAVRWVKAAGTRPPRFGPKQRFRFVL